MDDALEAGVKFSKFTKGNFRINLIKLIGNAPNWMKKPEAHHILPQKFESYFNKMGIDIHNPIYGTWVDKITHSEWSYKYNKEWEKFINSSTKKTTVNDIFKFANSLAKKYGFSTHY